MIRILSVVASTVILSSVLTKSTLAQNLPSDSSVFTGKPPTLIEAETFDHEIGVPNTNYYFTIKLPSDSQESLGKVIITPQNNEESIKFDADRTIAFLGTQSQKGQAIALTATQTKDGVVSVFFDPPIAPGTTFTVGLKAEQNPDEEGFYNFAVQAFPTGKNSVGFDVGEGRFSIDR